MLGGREDAPLPSTILDCRDEAGRGVWLHTEPAEGGEVARVLLNSTTGPVAFPSDPLSADTRGKVTIAVVVDGGPQMVHWVMNGRFADGGTGRPLGYGFFPQVGDLNGAAQCRIGVRVESLRVYGRYLHVSELVANYRNQTTS